MPYLINMDMGNCGGINRKDLLRYFIAMDKNQELGRIAFIMQYGKKRVEGKNIVYTLGNEQVTFYPQARRFEYIKNEETP